MNYDIRMAVAEDAEEMSALIYDYHGSMENETTFLKHYSVDNLRARLEKGYEKGYIAIREDKIIGLICYRDIGFHVEITEILLKKGKSYGAIVASLTNSIFDSIKPKEGFKKILCSTHHDNEQSMVMLIKMGFLPEAFIRHGYRKDVHQVVWNLYIGQNGLEDDTIWP